MNVIKTCKYFSNNEHTFSKYGKFITIKRLQNTPTETLQLRIRERENFWIKKLKTWTPYAKNWTDTMLYSTCDVVHFTFFCVWTKNLTYISQLMSNNIISCCKSYLQLCHNYQEIIYFISVLTLKNQTHVKKVGHTSKFLFGIYWSTWKTNNY